MRIQSDGDALVPGQNAGSVGHGTLRLPFLLDYSDRWRPDGRRFPDARSHTENDMSYGSGAEDRL